MPLTSPLHHRLRHHLPPAHLMLLGDISPTRQAVSAPALGMALKLRRGAELLHNHLPISQASPPMFLPHQPLLFLFHPPAVFLLWVCPPGWG